MSVSTFNGTQSFDHDTNGISTDNQEFDCDFFSKMRQCLDQVDAAIYQMRQFLNEKEKAHKLKDANGFGASEKDNGNENDLMNGSDENCQATENNDQMSQFLENGKKPRVKHFGNIHDMIAQMKDYMDRQERIGFEHQNDMGTHELDHDSRSTKGDKKLTELETNEEQERIVLYYLNKPAHYANRRNTIRYDAEEMEEIIKTSYHSSVNRLAKESDTDIDFQGSISGLNASENRKVAKSLFKNMKRLLKTKQQ